MNDILQPSESNETDDTRIADVDALPQGEQRFLAGTHAYLLMQKLRSPKDVLDAWPDLMTLLSAEERAAILCGAGICPPAMRMLALKKSARSAEEDVQLALANELVKPEDVLRHLPSRVCVERLGRDRLFAFFADGMLKRPDDERGMMLAFVLRTALENELLTAADIQHALTPEELAEHLQKTEIAGLIHAVRAKGDAGEVFTATDFLEVIQVEHLVRDIPHEILWERCILSFAAKQGWTNAPNAPTEESPKQTDDAAEAVDVTDVDLTDMEEHSSKNPPPPDTDEEMVPIDTDEAEAVPGDDDPK